MENNNKKKINADTKAEDLNNTKAHDEAEKDIEMDPDLDLSPAPEDDLDEGELARLEGEE